MPAEIGIRYYIWSRARFDRAGVHVGRGRRMQSYLWSEVESLEINRPRHDRDDFHRLVLELPRRKILLGLTSQHGIVTQSWKGPDARTLARFLTAHVPAERQLICASLDPPRSLPEADTRLAKVCKQSRELRYLRIFLWANVVGLATWCVVDRHWGCVASSLMAFAIYEPVFLMFSRRARESERDLVGWRAQLVADVQPSQKTSIACDAVMATRSSTFFMPAAP